MDLAASIVTAAATVVLAVVAFCQIRAGREQATEARKQATKALEIATAQAHSTVTIARETREAAERQWRPRVFARYHGEAVPAGEGFTVAPDEIAVPYYLINEGTGPAFNVQVGIEVGEQVWWRDSKWWSMQAREFIPELEPDAKQPVPPKKLHIGVKESQWNSHTYAYVTRFENLLGERFQVRSYADQSKPSEFQRISGTPPDGLRDEREDASAERRVSQSAEM